MVKVANVHADAEDSLLTDDVVGKLVRVHGLSKYWVARHLLIKGMECDAVIYGVIEKAFRTIGVELKQNDVVKVAEQALKRRHLFHYMYIVISWPTDWVIRGLHRHGLLTQVLSKGVGIITFENSNPFLAVRSAFNPTPEYRPNTLLTEFMRWRG